MYFYENVSTSAVLRNLMPPSISRAPNFSNQFSIPLEVREIGIPALYFTMELLQLKDKYALIHCAHNHCF